MRPSVFVPEGGCRDSCSEYVEAVVRGFNVSPPNRNLLLSLNSMSYWLCGLRCVSLPPGPSLFSSMQWANEDGPCGWAFYSALRM